MRTFIAVVYAVILTLSIVSAFAAAWALAIQLFIVSCLLLSGLLYFKVSRVQKEREPLDVTWGMGEPPRHSDPYHVREGWDRDTSRTK